MQLMYIGVGGGYGEYVGSYRWVPIISLVPENMYVRMYLPARQTIGKLFLQVFLNFFYRINPYALSNKRSDGKKNPTKGKIFHFCC